MLVKRFFEPLIAQDSYLIGCAATGKAIVIDPHRDADVYLRAAAEDNLSIAYVTETHIHADFVSGTRELAAETGATMLLSDEGPADWKYLFGHEARLVRSGDRLEIGTVRVDVMHTPGHTPEHVTFLITDSATADAPIAAATGDFIFVGDVGRPDLLEKAANISGTMEASARQLYRSLQAFKHHEDWLQIWPGHGAGSACGKGISAVPHSTLGYERRFNWAFKTTNEDDFVANVLAGQPDPPPYFATMKRINKEGPRALRSIADPRRFDGDALAATLASGALVVDARPATTYAAGFLPGTINIPLTNSFVTWAGWLVPYDRDVYLLLGDGADSRLHDAVRALALIGIDRVAGYFTESALGASGGTLDQIPQLSPREVASSQATVLDVRSDHEWDEGHIAGARHIPLGQLNQRLSELPTNEPLVVHCRTGGRSAIAASLLKRAGFRDVSNLRGGYSAWTEENLPTDAGTL